jgi:alkyldihydroxyacetonephosphate synthase
VSRALKHWGWGYEDEQPSPSEPLAAALRGAKAAVDPQGLLNPGVLIDP